MVKVNTVGLNAFDLERGRIYVGIIDKRPVKYMGMSYDTETTGLNPNKGLSVLWQFEYVLPEHLPPKDRGGVAGYGQTEEQVSKESYTVAKSLDVIYGPK